MDSVKSTLDKIAVMELPDADYVEDIADILEKKFPATLQPKPL